MNGFVICVTKLTSHKNIVKVFFKITITNWDAIQSDWRLKKSKILSFHTAYFGRNHEKTGQRVFAFVLKLGRHYS